MVDNELEQEDTLSCVRVRLATIAYLDILLCSIWAIHKIRQSPIPKCFVPEITQRFHELVLVECEDCGCLSTLS